MSAVTVALSDVAEFTARFGVHLRRVGQDSAGLPLCEWVADEWQTAGQAREWREFVATKPTRYTARTT